MPGVNILTTTRGDVATPLPGISGTFFVAGLAERGPVDRAIVVRGLADFEAVYGARTAYSHLYDAVKTYFEEGGVQAYISRVVGTGATRGSIPIVDRAVDPVETIMVNARSFGAWSSDVTVVVANGSAPDSVAISVKVGNYVVEQYNNLTSIAAIVNNFSDSQYLDVSNSGSATVAPENLPAVGEYILTAGTDDRITVNDAAFVKGLDLFTMGMGDGAVAIPGAGIGVHEGIIKHAEANRRIAILASTLDVSTAELRAQAGSFSSDSAGLFAPWILVSDGAGGTRPVPPEGLVAGRRAVAHDLVGPHRVPAGQMGLSLSASDVYVDYTRDQADDLDNSKVSVIRRINNSIRLYGWRSLSNDVINFGYLHHRDVLNRIVVLSEATLEEYVFSPIDAEGKTLSAVHGALVGILEPMRQDGVFYARISGEDVIDPGYVVDAGSAINTTASLAQNKIRAVVQVRIVPVGALIELTITKVGLTQPF